MTGTIGVMLDFGINLFRAVTVDVGVSDSPLFFTVCTLGRRSALRLDHHEGLVGVGARGNSVTSYAALTGVFDAVD